MARKKAITTETVKASALELLDLTLKAANKRFADAIRDDYPCEAALISASVALLKMVEAKSSLTDDDKAGDIAAQREAFNQRKPVSAQQTPADILALYEGQQ